MSIKHVNKTGFRDFFLQVGLQNRFLAGSESDPDPSLDGVHSIFLSYPSLADTTFLKGYHSWEIRS